jgi:Secretion system C-terminal sorting domain
MNKMLQPLISLFFIFSSFTAFACISTPYGVVVSSGNPPNCSYAVTVCVTKTSNSLKHVLFTINGQLQDVDANATAVGTTICHTFGFTLPCGGLIPQPLFSGTAEGYTSNNNSATCALIVFNPFSESSPLPVELISFKATLQNDQSVIEWVTASEENNDYFEVHHSTNARDFIPIAIERGHGTTTELQHYKVTHSKPDRGDNYYRIKQVDYDGTFEIFDMVVVRVEGDIQIFNVYPSEVFDVVTLETPDFSPKDTEVSIHNANGLLMRKSILAEGAYKISIDVSDLPAGPYFIRFIDENYDYTAKTFIKMKD